MDKLMTAIRMLEMKYYRNGRVIVFLTKYTVKKLVKMQADMGIGEDSEVDFSKENLGWFAGYPVKLADHNSVAFVSDEIYLSDDIL